MHLTKPFGWLSMHNKTLLAATHISPLFKCLLSDMEDSWIKRNFKALYL